ncbi:phage terminase large subunit [Eubacteriales bacterium OttesenSCG-928-M02]|nr:phage terminase large subunit [Eubacteriales bacterium OttesenSCG-928-M02]
MKEYVIDYTPTEKQKLFHQSQADEVLFGGAAGGGKSAALAMEAAIRCLLTPGIQVYLFRRSYRELLDTLVLQARRFIPKEVAKFSQSSMNMEFINGSSMRFRHCHQPEDRYQYAGVEMHGLFIDEVTHFPLPVYDYLKTRLRAERRLGIKPVVRCASNPGGPGHGWVKARFIDIGPAMECHETRIKSRLTGAERVRTVQYIPARVTDNSHIDEGYIYELEDKPKALREALLLGNWNAFTGQVFDEWVDNPDGYETMAHTHVIKPFPLPPHYRRYRAFDFGYARPFAVLWFSMDENDRAYLYREWYGGDGNNVGIKLTAKEIAKGIRQMEEAAGERDVLGFADPSIWDGSRGESIAQQMEGEGVYFTPGENARIAGKMQMHRRLAFDEEGRPGLYVFDTCRNFIRTIPQLGYDPHRPEDVDTRGEDHLYDAARYFLMARPVGKAPEVWAPKPFDPLG